MKNKKLLVRQSLAYRTGESKDPSWHVGYWDNKRTNSDDDFRSLGSRQTEAEAIKLAEELTKQHDNTH